MFGRPGVWFLLTLCASVGACDDSDVGECCRALTTNATLVLPTATVAADGSIRDRVARDPGFDCEMLTCTSWKGSEPFCTAACDDVTPCEDGFSCEQVLEADPGPGAMITTDDRFCVRKTCSANADCPDDFECLPTEASSLPGQPVRKQCVRPEQLCEPSSD